MDHDVHDAYDESPASSYLTEDLCHVVDYRVVGTPSPHDESPACVECLVFIRQVTDSQPHLQAPIRSSMRSDISMRPQTHNAMPM
jgi:hypothetical protein